VTSGTGNPRVGRAAGVRVGWVAAALICAGAAAGCSSSSPATSTVTVTATPTASAAVTGTGAPTSTSTSPAGAAACATSALHVTQGTPQGYAGGIYQPIIFTNASGASCTLYGYPGVSLVSAPPYTQIGLAAKRSSTTPVKLITLAPGAAATSVVHIVDAGNFSPSTCSPVKAAYLRVYPPNQTVPVYLANTSQTCSKPVQTLSVSAVQAGSGG